MFDPNTKILLADDMPLMRKAFIKFLKEIGFNDFTEAGDGVEAWEKISSATPPFGLIISDWTMPNCKGIDLLKRVRADSRFKTVPFLMVTAESEREQVMDAIKSGASGYLVKPFTVDSLREKLLAVYQKQAA